MSQWIDVCAAGMLLDDVGVCALIDGTQVAIFRLHSGEIFALGNMDPFSGAAVIYRGIVGDRGGVPKVASPVYKQSFDLGTGSCLDDPGISLPIFPVRESQGRIELQIP